MAPGGYNSLHDAVEETCKRAYELLKCRVCTTSMSPPIYECPNGHLVCSICKIQVQSLCTECGVNIGDTRCLVMEKVSNLLKGKHPCYDCPYNTSECLVKGNPPQLVKHLNEDHNVDIHYGSEFTFSYVQSHLLNQTENENATGMLQVINCYGRQFCLYFEPCLRGEVPCYIAFVMFMGENSEAQTFKCSLDIGASNNYLTWQGITRSICDNHQNVRDSLDGLVIPPNLFSNGDDHKLKLQVKGRLWVDLTDYTEKFRSEEEAFVVRASHGFVQKPLSITSKNPELLSHLKDDRDDIMHYGSWLKRRYVILNACDVENDRWMLTVFNCYGEQFCLHLDAFHLGVNTFYILFLRLVGEDIEAKKFKYSLQVDTENGGVLMWQGVPRSIHENIHPKVCDGLDGVVIPPFLARFLSRANEKELSFQVMVRIWKQE
ncbi:hypothetical protein CTI12_AA384200 [Artemisia annua]|uniref:Uncharacterized protein n=1 Tax=Artemisia annua TaxID=35608 RepID=A0A2U1MG25_ARTAN|nr:hypothetical protein CTI12_AA384200 [Artemisia annua]